MTYRNLKTEQSNDGKYVVSVEVLSPKPFKLLFSDKDENKAKEEISKYLISQNATEENKVLLELPRGTGF